MSKESSAVGEDGRVVFKPEDRSVAVARPGKTNRDKNVTGSWFTHNQNRAANAEVQRNGGSPKKGK